MPQGMTLLFAEHGSRVACYDYDRDAVQKVMQQAKDDKDTPEGMVHGFTKLKRLVGSFGKGERSLFQWVEQRWAVESMLGGVMPEACAARMVGTPICLGEARCSSNSSGPRLFLLSLPHGKPVDGVESDLLPLLAEGDIVIDAGNEWWESTEKRQGRAAPKGVEWVGMGVSGGCESGPLQSRMHLRCTTFGAFRIKGEIALMADQAARHGPSMSAGCTKATWEKIRPKLEKWAAKTPKGEPCVMRMGPGGAGPL